MTDQEAALSQQLLTQVNQDRSANGGLAAYVMSDALISSAYKHDQVMASGCGEQHQCPGEADFGTRIRNAGASWSDAGENIDLGKDNSSYWQGLLGEHQSMMNEQPPDDGHRQNLLSQNYHNIGIGVFIAPDGTIWLTEDFTN
jgi:uncharacterized protein YkwD